jgi:hypothetical protein
MYVSREVTVEGVVLRADGAYYPASKGERERGSGVQLSPDEPATFEVTAVHCGGDDIADILSAGRLEEIGNLVVEAMAEEPDDPNA